MWPRGVGVGGKGRALVPTFSSEGAVPPIWPKLVTCIMQYWNTIHIVDFNPEWYNFWDKQFITVDCLSRTFKQFPTLG